MSKVLVDRQLLDSAATWLEVHAPGGGCVEGSVAEDLRAILEQPAEAEVDRIASGFVILDGMAFSKDEILAQRVDLCNALESLSAVTAERDLLSRWKQTAEYWYGQYRLVKHGESPAEYPTEGKLDDWHNSYHDA